MEENDEILIELNRSQAVLEGGNAQWTNSTPSLILNEGDTIKYLGGWLSVRNSGDNSIEIYNQDNPDQSMDISFKFSFYKTLNGINVATTPFMSFKFTDDPIITKNYYYYGFSQGFASTANGSWASSNTTSPNIATIDEGNTFLKPDFTQYGYYTAYASYDSLINEQDADVYNEGIQPVAYLQFLRNFQLKQGMRDLANNNERYTACYQDSTSYIWDTYEHKVNANFEPGFASPENIASFITESMQQTRKLVTAYPDTNPIKEVWTNAGRFFKTMSPVAVENVNISTAPSAFTKVMSGDAPQATEGAWGSISADAPTQTGFIKTIPITITEINYSDNTKAIDFADNIMQIRGTYTYAANASVSEKRMLNYIYRISQYYTGNNPGVPFGQMNSTQLDWMYNSTGYDETPDPAGKQGGMTGYPIYDLKCHNPNVNRFQIGVTNVEGQNFQVNNASGQIGGTVYGSLANFDPANPLPGTEAHPNPLTVTQPIQFDASTRTYTFEFYIYYNYNDGEPDPNPVQNAQGDNEATVADNPDPVNFNISVGGNPYAFNCTVADPLPFGVPMVCGSASGGFAGQPFGYNQTDQSARNAAIRDFSTQPQNLYTWCPYKLDLESNNGQLMSINPVGSSQNTYYFNDQPQFVAAGTVLAPTYTSTYSTGEQATVLLDSNYNRSLGNNLYTLTNGYVTLSDDGGTGGVYSAGVHDKHITFDAGANNHIEINIQDFEFHQTAFNLRDRIGIQASDTLSDLGTNGSANLNNLLAPDLAPYLYQSNNPAIFGNSFHPDNGGFGTGGGYILPSTSSGADVKGNTFPSNLINSLITISARYVRFYFRTDAATVGGGFHIQVSPKLYSAGSTTDTDTQNARFLDYTRGNRVIGCTMLNWNRWSLLQEDFPPTTADAENDENLMPTLRKFPNFLHHGSKLMILNSVKNGLYMPYADRDLTDLTFTPLSQKGKLVGEGLVYGNIAQAIARAGLYRNFIEAQIFDGMIDLEKGRQSLDYSRDQSIFFTHISLETTANPNLDTDALLCRGSDGAIRERPRGLLCYFDIDSFNNKNTVQLGDDANQTLYVSNGVRIKYNKANDTYQIYYPAFSWIYDKIFGGIFANGESTNPSYNFGFLDANMLQQDFYQGNNKYEFFDFNSADNNPNGLLSLVNADPQKIKFGVGFSYMKNAWKGHSAFLCSTQVRSADDYSCVFNPQLNRQNRLWSSSLWDVNEGSVEYSDRYFLGAREPLLQFGTDNNSRFYFSQLFQPIQVGNTFREGTEAVGATNVTTTCTDPIYNLVDLLSDGYSFTDTAADPDVTLGYNIDLPDNAEAGNDAVFYQRRLWNTYHDGIPIFAPEVTKHQPMFWKCKASAGADSAEFCGNHPTGESFLSTFPVLNDDTYITRFFMFNQQARANSFTVVNTISARYPQLYDPNYQKDAEGNPTGAVDTTLKTGRNFPSAFWGCLAGDKVPYLNKSRQLGETREFQAGVDVPLVDKIYDTQGGVALENFLLWNRGNWQKSLWRIMGFDYQDLNPDPFVGVRNTRNFTRNFLQDPITNNYDANVFHTSSRPLTTNASLTTAGFIEDTTSVIGEKNYSAVTPMATLIFTGNLQSEYYDSVLLKTLFNEQGNNLQLEVVYNTNGGSNLINNELFFNEFFNIKIASSLPYGSYILASNVPSKLEIPYYLIKSDLPELNTEFVNNANTPSQMPVVGIISKQYGATSDWYYSDNQLDNAYVNKKKRVITSIKTELIDSNGNLAATLLDKSSIFLKITRANPTTPFRAKDPENLELREEITNKDKKTKKSYKDEIDAYLGIQGD